MPIDYFVFSSFITQFNVKCIYSLASTQGNVNIIIIDYIEVMKSLRLLRLRFHCILILTLNVDLCSM